MSRIAPLPAGDLPDIEAFHRAGPLGFLPNSVRILARRPEIALAFQGLLRAIFSAQSGFDPSLRSLISQVASRASGCRYCMAHTAHSGLRAGLSAEKENALWEYETSPLFSPAERAALRVAQGAAVVPNAVTDEDFAALRSHYSDEQCVEIVALISLFGFLNRFNDTMATELEAPAIAVGQEFLASHGWSVGKHGAG